LIRQPKKEGAGHWSFDDRGNPEDLSGGSSGKITVDNKALVPCDTPEPKGTTESKEQMAKSGEGRSRGQAKQIKHKERERTRCDEPD
jgi:hypothetical protein